MAGVEDLACMKLAAVAQRGARKDFRDLHVLCRNWRPLPTILRLFSRKYDQRDLFHVLTALACFDDAEEDPDPVLLERVPWEEIKKDFRDWVREIAREKGLA